MSNFRTSECAWSNVTMKILGRTLVGLRGFELGTEQEKEYLYGAGDDPLDIQSGQKKYSGNIKLLKYEVDLLNDAARAAGFDDILGVPHEAVVITSLFKKRLSDPQRTITVIGVAFTEVKVSGEQNAKNFEVTLPFIAMKQVIS